jgi:predicted dehydrogenase
MGGGVAIDLIHEWDYLSWLFGMPEKVNCIIGQHSSLEIDSDDVAVYIAIKGRLSYELHLDYFGRKTMRQLQVFMPEETIEADITNGEVRYLVEGKTIALHEDRNMFQLREIQHFFDIIEGKCKNDNDIKEAIAVLKIAEGITE